MALGRSGLYVVVGPRRSGRSTTLGAVLDCVGAREGWHKSRDFHGYWIAKPEVDSALDALEEDLREGTRGYDDLTEEEKTQLFTTEHGYYRRAGIKDLLTRYFTAG